MLRIVKGSGWRAALGLAVSLFCLLGLLKMADLGSAVRAVFDAEYLFFLPAVAVYFAGLYLRAVRWRFQLGGLADASVGRLLPVVLVGHAVNNLLPARLGELVRAVQLSRREGVPGGAALGSVVVERVFDGLALLGLGLVTLPVLLVFSPGGVGGLLRTPLAMGVMSAFFAVVLLVLALLTALAVNPRARRRFCRFFRLFPGPPAAGLERGARSFSRSLVVLGSPKRQLFLFLLSLAVWGLEIVVYHFVAMGFDLAPCCGTLAGLYAVLAFLVFASNLATVVPGPLGGIGPFEVVIHQVLVVVGAASGVAAAYALSLHLLVLWLPVSVVGVSVLLWQLGWFRRTGPSPGL